MITASLYINVLTILHQRLAATRQRLDALQNNRELIRQLIDIERAMDERSGQVIPSHEWSNMISDAYTRCENLGDELDELEASDGADGWVEKQQVVGKKLTELNREIDQHFAI